MENNDQADFDSHPVEHVREMHQDMSQPEESKNNGCIESINDQVVPAEPQEHISQDFPSTDVSRYKMLKKNTKMKSSLAFNYIYIFNVMNSMFICFSTEVNEAENQES